MNSINIFITKGPCKCGHTEIEHKFYGDGKCWKIVKEPDVRCWCNEYEAVGSKELEEL